ncbi:translation initiation factor IF-2 subunit beta [Haloprofundus salinisoli]|uniref:translation initiation factor IF-2 subunit beta n=1 Tax=Haloprofundus salinisoli TaxID=2876193 RepID=UPI001CCB9E6F|nr:translation initiation factor IF-2 subunit beta [Haloprofundus salinisoli]
MEYDDQLERALAESPDIESTGSRFEVPDPNVRPEGNMTVFENFQSVVDKLDRDESDVLKFLQTELGTSGQIDESGRARLTGDFRRDRVARAVEEYTEAFVLCPECGLPDTRLVDEREATMLKCDACGALSSMGQ